MTLSSMIIVIIDKNFYRVKLMRISEERYDVSRGMH